MPGEVLALAPDDCQWYGTMCNTMTDQSHSRPASVDATDTAAEDRSWWQTFPDWPLAARLSVYGAGALVLVLVAALIIGSVIVHRPLPETSGELEVPGLTDEVTVVRDDHGIPQLYGDSVDDLMRAQGFVHAQERFFEMDVRRHVTAGRLSELFGESAVETDTSIRTMGWRRVAEQELGLVKPETRAALQSYADGVNAYLETTSPGELALEYTLLRAGGTTYQPEPWTPVDSLAWLKAMAWDLRGNMTDEVNRVLALAEHSPEQVAQLYPPYPYEENQPIVGQGAVVDGAFEQDATEQATRLPQRPAYPAGAREALRRARDSAQALPAMLGKGDGIGSNSWVVDGEHSSTGKPILANDPHLGVTLPGIWVQMGLHCRTVSADCPLDVGGFTFSGVPGVVIGHNADIAWGFTNLGPDVSDLYLERVRGDEWRYDGKWRPLRTRTETIEVAGGEDVRIEVRSTKHGPLVSDHSEGFAEVGEQATPEHPGARRHATTRWRSSGRPWSRRPPPTRSSTSTRPTTGAASARRPPSSTYLPRTSCTPTARATSATRRRDGSRSASRATTATSRPRAGGRTTTGPATTSRSKACRTCSTPRRGSSSPPTRRSWARSTRSTSPTTGTAATVRSGSAR